jgi:intracellular sulfur oxidation DsrE/DsrF family protein
MTSRKDFLLSSSLAAVVQVPSPSASPGGLRAPLPLRKRFRGDAIPFDFNRAQFDAILAKPAKHKQCFGSKKIDGGSVIEGMTNTINAYDDYYNEPDGSAQTVAVLYHGFSIALALSNTVWNDILVPLAKNGPKELRDQLTDVKPGKGNPYLAKIWVPGIVARGASFFLCNNALSGIAGVAADVLKESATKVHSAMLAGIVPGAMAVPAGVMAINAAQEARFTYIAAN